MWHELTWQSLGNPDIADDVKSLRNDTLRFFLWATAVGYLVWHSINAYQASPADFPRYWLLFPVVALGLLLTHILLRRSSRYAAWCFLLSLVVSTIVATLAFATPFPIRFLPLVVLVTVVLLNPLTGLLLSLWSLGVVVVLWETGPLSFLTGDQLIATSIMSLITVVIAWALGRNMVTAVEWALDSYNQSLRKTHAAQSHRAELVRALKQLDHAYYRLERANSALELAWKAAEAAERSKSEFVSNISHELRTPLNLIVGFTEMIVTAPESYGEPLPAAYRGDMNAIYRSAQHLLTLTDDVLDLARLGVDRLSLAREPVDVTQVIADACAIIREYVVAKGLWLHVNSQDGLPILTVDRLRIRQVLLNLMTNAARFTDHGGITIAASRRADGSVLVKVTDTGRGIAPLDVLKVFTEFYQANGEKTAHEPGTRQPGFGGVGLGLPLSKRFVELHGGQMGVESEIDVGTTFWFTLPAITSDGHGGSELALPLRYTSTSGAAERVLVLVDGDNSLARFLQHHLRGYRVIFAPDVAKAIAIAIESRAIALLADIDTVGLDDVRDLPVPVIRVPLPHEERMAATLGVAAYLVKPVTRTDLLAAIARLKRPIRTVLVADDDPRFIRLLRRFLRSAEPTPYDVLVAHDGREALVLIEERRPDLVLLDLLMPHLSGDGVLGAMAEKSDLADIPAIIISAREQGGGRLVLQGPLSFSKPDGFRFEELLSTLETLLGAIQPSRQYLMDHSAVSSTLPTSS